MRVNLNQSLILWEVSFMEFDKLVQYVEDHKKEHFAKIINQNKTTHWVDTYPHEVYASVLLLDNKIINYKIGERFWSTPLEAKIYTRKQIDFEKLKTEYTSWTVYNSEEHNKAFEVYAREWFKQWEVHDDYFIGASPY
jgi:hypothetical protein